MKAATKTLILPDVHLKTSRADKIISSEGSDKIVILGDIFDDFYDTSEMNRAAAIWIKQKLHDPKYVVILGNHDINYAIPDRRFKCSGYEYGKEVAINQILNEDDWKKFQLYHWIDNDLVATHAGVHPFYFEKYGNGRDFKTWLAEDSDAALQNAFSMTSQDPLLRSGRSRGGIEVYGGIMWCDYSEFEDVFGIRQVFGHTPIQVWNPKKLKHELIPSITKNHLALDTHLSHYAIYDDFSKTYEIKKYIDL